MQQKFEALRAFDFARSRIYLWVFKRSAKANKFSAFFVQTDDVLNALLLRVVQSEIDRITEFASYTYLAETNENSCLVSNIAGTDFESLKAVVDQPEPDFLVQSVKDLKNAEGYLVKFTHNGQTVYAVKRSTSTWKTSYLKTHINVVFRNGELSAAEDDRFAIEKTFDFYAFDSALFIASKRAFESVMAYRTAYTQAFAGLQGKPTFSALFTTLQPLVDYVGTNSIQLRRMATIEQRALFLRPGFLAALQAVNAKRQWGLNFDSKTNQLIPSRDTIRTIVQVLLDHRLLSEVTQNIYDVPDATLV